MLGYQRHNLYLQRTTNLLDATTALLAILGALAAITGATITRAVVDDEIGIAGVDLLGVHLPAGPLAALAAAALAAALFACVAALRNSRKRIAADIVPARWAVIATAATGALFAAADPRTAIFAAAWGGVLGWLGSRHDLAAQVRGPHWGWAAAHGATLLGGLVVIAALLAASATRLTLAARLAAGYGAHRGS